MKACTKCGETKPLEEFYRHPTMKSGRQPRCKACYLDGAKATREAKRATTPARKKGKQPVPRLTEEEVDQLRRLLKVKPEHIGTIRRDRPPRKRGKIPQEVADLLEKFL